MKISNTLSEVADVTRGTPIGNIAAQTALAYGQGVVNLVQNGNMSVGQAASEAAKSMVDGFKKS